MTQMKQPQFKNLTQDVVWSAVPMSHVLTSPPIICKNITNFKFENFSLQVWNGPFNRHIASPPLHARLTKGHCSLGVCSPLRRTAESKWLLYTLQAGHRGNCRLASCDWRRLMTAGCPWLLGTSLAETNIVVTLAKSLCSAADSAQARTSDSRTEPMSAEALLSRNVLTAAGCSHSSLPGECSTPYTEVHSSRGTAI